MFSDAMHRFHIAPESWESATLDAEESHHCLNVLRLGAGDRITVFDGAGNEATATIVGVAAGRVTFQAGGPAVRSHRPPAAITLAQAIPKGKNMDLIVQKAVELGAAGVVPILSDRTVVQLDGAEAVRKQAKWRDVALEACKQCGQNFLPQIATPVTLRQFFDRADACDLALIASLQPDARPIKRVLADYVSSAGRPPARVVVFIGPEGDFTPAELALAKSHGCQPVTLGPIILRTETAALYCLSVLAHELFIAP